MTCYSPFTSACTPTVAEYLITRLFSEGFPTAVLIVTKELPHLQIQNDTTAKDRQILNSPHVPAMYTTANPSAIGTPAIFKG